MDVTFRGVWGYHPLVISLANKQGPLFLENRSGSRPSHEGAAARLDQAIELCTKAGFRRMLLRGDTDFSQSRYLDGWSEQGVKFIFGIDAMLIWSILPTHFRHRNGNDWSGRPSMKWPRRSGADGRM
jgi:hypothetical protein